MTLFSERFYLRPLTKTDVSPRYVEWLNDDMARRFILSASEKPTVESVREYVDLKQNDPSVIFWGIFLRSTGQHIGNIKYEPIDFSAGTAVMGILIGEPDWRGRGVAAEVLNETIQFLVSRYRISTVVLGVDRQNVGAIRAYKKAGFFEEATDILSPSNDSISMVRTVSPDSFRGASFCLGTAQFGSPYGIANKAGKVPTKDAEIIIKYCDNNGIDTLDTASLYGNAESILGEVGVQNWKVITKLQALPDGLNDVSGWVEKQVTESLARLKVPKLYGLLLHRPNNLFSQRSEELIHALSRVKESGLVSFLGVSVYSPEEIDDLLSVFPAELIQLPYNVLDQRFRHDGTIQKLNNSRIEVHARSLFLQGLLLMDSNDRPKYFQTWYRQLHDWDEYVKNSSLPSVAVCTRFVWQDQNVQKSVIGVQHVDQLQAIINTVPAIESVSDSLLRLRCEDQDLINPNKWNIESRV